MTVCFLENGPVEIVDLLIKDDDFPVRFLYVYQAGYFQFHDGPVLNTAQLTHRKPIDINKDAASLERSICSPLPGGHLKPSRAVSWPWKLASLRHLLRSRFSSENKILVSPMPVKNRGFRNLFSQIAKVCLPSSNLSISSQYNIFSLTPAHQWVWCPKKFRWQ